ncbi:MAG: hypothetical protein HQ515_09465 [Phycisphaeraceae bacterium]|nr:hypothetical protein [Phycisphaeraceae bacterium]
MEIQLSNVLTDKAQDITVLTNSTQFGKIENEQSIHGINLLFTIAGVGATAAEIVTDIADIRVKYNGELIINRSADELLDLYKYRFDKYGAFTVAGVVPIIFKRNDLMAEGLAKGYSLGMVDSNGRMAGLVVEVDYKAVVLAVTKCELHYEYDLRPARDVAGKGNGIGKHVRQLRYPKNWPTASLQDIADLPRSKAGVSAIAYHFSKATLSHLTVHANSNAIINNTHLNIINRQLDQAGRTPQTGYVHLDFSKENDENALLPVSSLHRFVVSALWTTKPDDYLILADELHPGL